MVREETETGRSGATILKHDAVGTYLLFGFLPQFHKPLGVLLKGDVLLRFRLPTFHLDGRPSIVYRHEDDDALRGLGVQTLLRVARANLHHDVQARFARVD